MKRIATIFILFTTFISQSQDIYDDLSNFNKTVLPNGLTIVTVSTKKYEYVNYKIFFDYNLVDEPTKNSVKFFAEYMLLDQNGKTQLSTTKVSDTNAIDSTFMFINDKYFSPTFDQQRIDTKKTQIKNKLKQQKTTFLGHKRMSNYFCFGKKNVYSNYLKTEDLKNINNQSLQRIYIHLIKPSQTTIVVVGNISADSINKYATKNFLNWNDKQVYSPLPEVKNLSNTVIHYQEESSANNLSISFPIDYFYTDVDFFAKKILFQIFDDKIKKKLSKQANNIIVENFPRPFAPSFLLFYNFQNKTFSSSLNTTFSLLIDMIIYPLNSSEITLAKQTVIKNFNSSLKNPFKIADYAYYLSKYELDKDFFRSYIPKIKNLTSLELSKSVKSNFKPNKSSVFVQGDLNSLICQLHQLAKFYKVEFYDEYLFKYKIIQKGFDSQFIIDDYLNACHASSEIQNMTINFSVKYFADTVYNAKGIIYKKTPDFYYYKNELIIDQDTLLQKLQIANKTHWVQKNGIKSKIFDDKDIFWNSVFETSIFPEFFYNKLKYTHQIICDTVLIKKNIFKLKISTPNDIIIYDYYDLSVKEKIRTEKIKYQNGITDTLQIIEYFNYKQISDNSEIKMPFTIKEKIKNFDIHINLDEIDTKTRIKKKQFIIDLKDFEPEQDSL
ncbi:MAG: insulinase family protein [Bacteroidota bacterium]|nr:insulinase family protein [Bacteroidota bacterium]